MLSEYGTKRQRVLEEIQRFSEGKLQDTSTFGVSMAATNEAQATIIKLVNPTIITPEHRIVILGTVFIASLLECKKVVQCRHTTTGETNRYPQIVEDMLRTGESRELSRIGRDDMRGANVEINNLRQVWTGNHEKGLVFLTSVNPITSVSEYTIDGRHTSGVPLRGLTAPLIIEAEGAYMEYTSSSGVVISDSRRESRGSVDLISPRFVIDGVQNSISIRKKNDKVWLGDIVTISSVILAALGFVMTITKAGRKLIEIGIPLLIAGILLFLLRFFTEWGKTYFAPGEREITGEAPLEMSFYGELA